MKTVLLFASFYLAGFGLNAQIENRLRPGQMYSPGQPVYAPRFGFRSVIPKDWEGTLPREAEIFLLMPLQPVDAQIYTLGNEHDTPDDLIKRWTTGIDMGDGITLIAKGPIKQQDGRLEAEAILKGSTNTADRKFYAEAKCSSYGICVSYVLMANKASYEMGRTALEAFVSSTVLEEPRNISIYEGFDWKKFLTNREMVTYDPNPQARKTNEVHFCEDGTFTSFIKRSGLLKQEAKGYQGKKTGTWSVGKGQRATLTLVFKKLPAAEIELFIEDEKVYANGTRHYVAYSDRCPANK